MLFVVVKSSIVITKMSKGGGEFGCFEAKYDVVSYVGRINVCLRYKVDVAVQVMSQLSTRGSRVPEEDTWSV